MEVLRLLQHAVMGTVVRGLAAIERLRGRAVEEEVSGCFDVGGYMFLWGYSARKKAWWATWGRRPPDRP